MIEPALTPEQWASPPDTYSLCVEWDGHEHAIAAIALNGQPFGFTRDDVVILRQLPAALHGIGLGHGDGRANFAAWVSQLADRIEALLPPE